MRSSKTHAGRKVWPLLTSAIACLGSSAALAQNTTSAVPVTYFAVQQPVDVCTDAGTSCAYINNNLQTVLSSPTKCVLYGVNRTCANLLVGFIDPVTRMLAHRNIWSAVGIDLRQTPVVQYNSTSSQTLKIQTCNPSTGTTNCMSPSFSALAQQPDIAFGTSGTPTFPRNPSPTMMNMFFVKNICSVTNPSCTLGNVDGFSALNGNGISIANLTFLPQSSGRPDTPAHEAGHNFADDHMTFGAGGPTNLMTAGGTRTVPAPLPPPGSKMDKWVLQVSPNGSAADLLTMGGSCSSLNTCDNQQGATQLSGFLNATPQAFTSLCNPCGEAGIQAAAASPQAQSTNSGSPQFDISAGFSDACYPDYPAFPSSSTCANASLAEVVIILTQGKFDDSSGKSFQITFQSQDPVLAGKPTISHGNANDACQGLGPTTWCLDLKIAPGAITVANRGFIDFTIGTKPSTVDGLAGTVCYFWESAPGVAYYNSCADLSSSFGFASSDSQMVNLALNPLIPLTFVGTPGQKPCTTDTTCPDPTSTYTDDSIERTALPSDRR